MAIYLWEKKYSRVAMELICQVENSNLRLLGIWFQFLIIHIFHIHSPCMWIHCFLQFPWICSFWVCSSSSKKKNVSKFNVSIDETWQIRYMCMWLIEKTDSKIEVIRPPTKLHPMSFHKLQQQIGTDLIVRERSKNQGSDLSWGVCRLCEVQSVSLTLS